MSKGTRPTHRRIWLDSCNPDSLSFASYEIQRDWGNINLADCNRRISYYFESKRDIKKLDRLIAFLEEARVELEKVL